MKTTFYYGFMIFLFLFSMTSCYYIENEINEEENNTDSNFKKEVEFEGGNGTENDPYLVSNADQFNSIRFHLSSHFKQISDISLEKFQKDMGWLPIGAEFENKFSGSYNGNGFSISGLKIDRNTDYTGLFGCTSHVVLSNISILNADISGGWIVGTLVASTDGLVQNCSATGKISRGSRVGGLVGANTGKIKKCFANVIISANKELGGFVGLNLLAGTIDSCYASGNVNGFRLVGGFIGDNWLQDKSAVTNRISNCNATGNVTGDSEVGGFIGENSGNINNCHATGSATGYQVTGGFSGAGGGTITECYATGNVKTTDWLSGGFAGDFDFGVLRRCFATGNVFGRMCVGGLIGSSTHASVTDCYSCGDVTATEKYVGSLIGEINYFTTITNCYATGDVDGKDFIGGCIGGYDTLRFEVNSCYYNTTITGLKDIDRGTPKSTSELKSKSTFLNWNFNSVWEIDEGVSYPTLRFKKIF